MSDAADVSFAKGFQAWGLACGIKKNGKEDLGVIVSEPPAQAFGVLTRNAVKAAPVLYCQQVLATGRKVSHVLVNSGNANACTGARGYDDVLTEAEALRTAANPKGEILVSSTGVIGEYLPMPKLEAGIRDLFNPAPGRPRAPFVQAIMTTDTFPKKAQASLALGGREVRLGGVAKGAGMIRPDMATMLAYVTTDIALEPDYRGSFADTADRTFNSISVDGDMSTNDTALLLANGASGVRYADLSAEDRRSFDKALAGLMEELAKSIVRDGEGATKLVTVKVTGARSESDAKAVCRAVSNSPLVKTAFFGGDANWGRVVAAAGASGVDLDKEKLALEFCGVKVLEHGGAAAYDEQDVSGRMKARDVSLTLDLGLGDASWVYWTCDFSYDYVKINAAYRT
jgi:glutamate N-acetyltransferase/amino-acid N-acetyltransferase